MIGKGLLKWPLGINPLSRFKIACNPQDTLIATL